MGGAGRQPMEAGEGQRHANESGWRGNPGKGVGPAEIGWARSGSGWKATPESRCRGAAAPWGRVSSRSRFLLPSASREKHTYTTKTLRGDFPPLLCYFCIIAIGKTKRWGKSGCITLSRSRWGCTGSWGPDFLIRPLEGQVLTKLYHSCQVCIAWCICFYLGCAF